MVITSCVGVDVVVYKLVDWHKFTHYLQNRFIHGKLMNYPDRLSIIMTLFRLISLYEHLDNYDTVCTIK